VVPANWNDAARNACVSGNEQADGRGWNFGGLLSDIEIGHLVIGLDGRCLYVPSQAEVQGQVRPEAIVVEDERPPYQLFMRVMLGASCSMVLGRPMMKSERALPLRAQVN